MTTDAATGAILAYAGGGWLIFWIQLPMLVLGLAVIITATIALLRARREDIPEIFAAFAAAFGHRRTVKHKGFRRSRSAQRQLHSPSGAGRTADFDEELR